MPNAIKYSTTGDTLSLKKGNIFFGVGDVGKGPSSATTYYNGVTPSAGGYTIYSYNVAQTSKLSFHTAVNDSALITYTNGVSGQNFSTATQCLNWYATQTNYVCVNRDYEGIVTNGLVLNLDAGFIPSYPTNGTTWYDLSYGGNNGTLTNGPTYNTLDGGSIVFDGVDDYATAGNFFTYQTFTINLWVKPGSSQTTYADIIDNNHTGAQNWVCQQNENDLNQYQFGVFGSSFQNSLTGTFTLTSNIWVNLTFTFDGDKVRGYINGSLFGTGASLGTTIHYAAPTFNIGRWNSGGRNWNGQYGMISVYNRQLTSQEILQNYNAQVSRFSASYDSDAQAFFTAAGITDTTQKNAVNQLVLDLKSYSLWNKMNAIYPFVGGTATTHKYNLKDPRDLNAAYRLSFAGGWTHSSNGVTPNGVNGYADTYFDGNVGAIGCYNRNTNFAMGTKYDEWEGGDYPVYSIPWIYLFGRSGTIQNTVDQQNTVNPAGASLPFAHITYDTQQRLYTNGNLVNSNAFYTSAPSAPTGYPIWIGGLNDNGRFNNPTYFGGTSSFSFISGTLNSTESANLNTAVQAFQTTLGRNV